MDSLNTTVKYFSIRTTTDYESVGNVYPQATSIYTNEKLIESLKGDQMIYNAFESMKNLYSRPADNEIYWEFKLEKKAKVTDALSNNCIVGRGLLISDRLHSILQEFKTENVEFIKCIVHDRSKKLDYFYLYLRTDLVEKHIDLKNTTFVLLDPANENFRLEYKVNNRQHFNQRMQNIGLKLLTTKDGLYFDNYLPSEDIIRLDYFEPNIFVSERLKEKIENSGVTGLDIGEEAFLLKAGE